MKRVLLALAIVLPPVTGTAQDSENKVEIVVEQHILPGMVTLAQSAGALSAAASEDCSATSQQLRSAYHDAFDAWVAISHLRFGPTEADDRAFALAFWPDSRGATPRTINDLIRTQDPIAADPDTYADMSIAARGFYALEFLLYDDALRQSATAAYRCMLIRTMTADIATLAAAINEDWLAGFAEALTRPSATGPYRSDSEAVQQLFKALSTGLQFTSETRLGRPLGTFDRPRPQRAEVWRSGRSVRHVTISLTALRDLALLLAVDAPHLRARLNASFDRAMTLLDASQDPVFAGVADPETRLRVEIIQQSIDAIRGIVRDELGPHLGVAAGFNALDGD